MRISNCRGLDDETYSGSCLGCGALSRARQGGDATRFCSWTFSRGCHTSTLFSRAFFRHTFLPVPGSLTLPQRYLPLYNILVYTLRCELLYPVNCKLYPGGAWELHWRELVLGGRAGGLCTINDTGMTCPASKNQIWKIQNLISPPFCIAHHINWSRQ